MEDVTLTLINLLFKHLEGSGCHAGLLFIDFSSTLNTIQPHILAQRLLEHFNLGTNLVGWILNYLTNRTQKIRVNGMLMGSVALHGFITRVCATMQMSRCLLACCS